MCARAHSTAYIFSERSYIGSRGTDDMNAQIGSRFAYLTIDDLQFFYINFYPVPLDLNALSSVFVKLPAGNFFRRIHRRRLLDPTAKSRQNSLDILDIQTRRILGLRLRTSGPVAGVGLKTETDDRFIFLFVLVDEPGKPRRFTYEKDHNAGSERIERAGVPDLLRFQDLAHAVHHVVRCHACRFIDY